MVLGEECFSLRPPLGPSPGPSRRRPRRGSGHRVIGERRPHERRRTSLRGRCARLRSVYPSEHALSRRPGHPVTRARVERIHHDSDFQVRARRARLAGALEEPASIRAPRLGGPNIERVLGIAAPRGADEFASKKADRPLRVEPGGSWGNCACQEGEGGEASAPRVAPTTRPARSPPGSAADRCQIESILVASTRTQAMPS